MNCCVFFVNLLSIAHLCSTTSKNIYKKINSFLLPKSQNRQNLNTTGKRRWRRLAWPSCRCIGVWRYLRLDKYRLRLLRILS